ncbi:hypothetical protein ABPG74_000388 [Tetrahymena malaccensis]
MISKKFFCSFLSLIGNILAYNLSLNEENNVPVFQPVPSLTINTIQLCKGGQSYQLFPFTQSSKNYVALSMTTCGIYIYDITDFQNYKLVFNNTLAPSGETTGISFSNITQYLWIAHSSGQFFGIDTKIQPFNIIVNGTSKGNIPINKITLWPLDNNILFLMCYTQFQIFDFRQQAQGLVYLQQVNVNGLNTFQINFVRSYAFALVTTSNIGIQFYMVNNGQDIENISFTYSCFLKPTFFDVVNFQLINENTIAIMMQYRGIYLYNIKDFLDYNGQVCTINIFQQICTTPNQGEGGQMYLSQDKKYLYAQFRQVGVRLYDMSQNTFQIVQNIFVESSSNDMNLNSSEDLLYYTNSLSLQIFQRTTPNFNREVPNLLLNTFQMASYNFFKEDTNLGNLDYYCFLNENKQELYLARADYGAAAFKYSGQGILESQSYVYRQQNSLFPTSRIAFLSDNSTAYLTRIGMGISIVDFSNPSSPIILKENVTLSSPFVAYVFVEFFKQFKFGFICNYINAYIISIEDPLNPFIISVLDTYKYTLGQTTLTRAVFNKDQNYVFMLLDSYGVITGNITNPLKPQIISSFFSHGCSNFQLILDDKYAVLTATFEGILIVQINSDYSLVQVSQLIVIGSIFNIKMMPNDQYFLATTYEYPSIILISIVDILNPVVVQIIGDTGAFGYYSICLSADNSQVFVTSQFYLYLLQIQNQIILHTQIYELKSLANSNEYSRQVLQKGQPLQVGQQIEMHLVPIYQTQGILVRDAQYYFQNVLQPLPSWMTFQPSTQILSLSISKNSLLKNNQGQYIDTIQQVVFLTYQSVTDSAFVNNYLQINSDDSLAIKQACLVTGYIDKSGYIQPSYTPSQKLSFGVNENIYLAKWNGSQLNLVKDFIQFILNQNIINYTINFYITQSIYVDLQNKNQMITSNQNDITVQLQMLEKLPDGSVIPTTKAKFVNKSYPSVLILISSAQDQLKMEGSLANINGILQNGVKYALSSLATPGNILIQMTVSDVVNYDYINTFEYQNLPFLSLQAPVTLSQETNLQQDLNSKYSGGQIFIQDSFQYQISSEVFTCPDSPMLQYSASIKQGDQFVNIPKDSWIQFSPTDRVFSGNPSVSNFNQYIVIQVNATDGYSFYIDKFTIIPNKIPFSYAFQLAIQILGPLFGLLGLYKYKHLIYNLSFKKQYIYSKDVAYVGEVYKKQIVITNQVRKQAQELWNFFKQKLGESEILYQLSEELMKENQVTSFEYYSPEQQKLDFQDIETDKRLSFEEEVMIKIYPYGVNSDEIGIVDKKSKKILIESSQKLNNAFKNSSLKKNENNINEDNQKEKYSNINVETGAIINNSSQCVLKQKKYEMDKLHQKRKSTYANFNSKSVAENIKQSLYMYDKITRLQHLEKNVNSNNIDDKISIFSEGQINFQQILIFIKEKQEQLPEKKRIINEQQLETLLNINSVLSQAISCFLVDYLLQKDKITKNIFDFMKNKACKYFLEIDWYKAYVEINPSFEEIHSNPYPQFTINEMTFRASLREIFRSLSRYYYDPITRFPKEIKFSRTLLQEAIKSRAIGFSIKPTQLLQVTQGESLHTFSHIIQSIKAFERNSDISCCQGIHKLLDIQYIEKGLTDNEKLPSWIHNIDLINGVILISGVPEKKDIGKIIIKVIDNEQFIVRSFQIQILQKSQDSTNLNQQNIFSNNKNQAQNDKKRQNSFKSSQFSQEGGLYESVRFKKASAFAKNANQQIELQQNPSHTMQGNSKVEDGNQPSFSRNDDKFIDLNEQNIQLFEENENYSKAIKTEREKMLEQNNMAQQTDHKPQQINDQSFVDSFDQSKLGILKDQIAN